MTRGWRLALAGPGFVLAGLILLALKLEFERLSQWKDLAVWGPGPGIALQLYGCQRILAAASGRDLSRALDCWLGGWFLFALGLPGTWAALGALNFLLQALILKMPLQWLLEERGLGAPWLTVPGLLALDGCLPFSGFSAYFQTFIPLMQVGEGVGDMRQKLFSSAGLWASVAMLAVVWQTAAFGYFYWSKVLQGAQDEGRGGGLPSAAMALGLGLSLALGLNSAATAAALRQILAILPFF